MFLFLKVLQLSGFWAGRGTPSGGPRMEGRRFPHLLIPLAQPPKAWLLVCLFHHFHPVGGHVAYTGGLKTQLPVPEAPAH